MGSLTVDIYRVTLNTTSTGMCSGVSHTREETTTSTSIVIDGLRVNSIYTVTISAINNEFSAINTTSGPTITTLEAGMFICIVVRVYLLCYFTFIFFPLRSGRRKGVKH